MGPEPPEGTCAECGIKNPKSWAGWMFVNRDGVGMCESHYGNYKDDGTPVTCPCGHPGSVNNGGLCDTCC